MVGRVSGNNKFFFYA